MHSVLTALPKMLRFAAETLSLLAACQMTDADLIQSEAAPAPRFDLDAAELVDGDHVMEGVADCAQLELRHVASVNLRMSRLSAQTRRVLRKTAYLIASSSSPSE